MVPIEYPSFKVQHHNPYLRMIKHWFKLKVLLQFRLPSSEVSPIEPRTFNLKVPSHYLYLVVVARHAKGSHF